MRESFKTVNFRADRLLMVEQCDQIITQYQAQGLRLTLRQLYYQLVTHNIIKNEERSYKTLGNLVSEARLGGLLDWDAIEDRVRVPKMSSEFTDLKELVRAALYSYRLPRWNGQEYYVELWVEKDAISGVLSPMAREYHITLMVNRGYSSQSAMYESSQRFMGKEQKGKKSILLYLGDHDPSGEDMVRDIQDRLTMFGSTVQVHKIALTMEQINEYNPPPNPAKLTDTRATAYIEKYGDSSWEVDALPPDALHQIVRDSIYEYVDMELMDTVKAKEESDKKRLMEFVKEVK
jgi:hypothetical protein